MNKGGRYFCTFVKKVILAKNKEERTVYNIVYIYNSLFRFFDYIIYTNKVYIDLIL